jgi:hypothetical protein
MLEAGNASQPSKMRSEDEILEARIHLIADQRNCNAVHYIHCNPETLHRRSLDVHYIHRLLRPFTEEDPSISPRELDCGNQKTRGGDGRSKLCM